RGAAALARPLANELRTGERAVVGFHFIKHPEYLRLGAKLLFREGVTKGIGHVTRLVAASCCRPIGASRGFKRRS
uniref:Uncharacterized protein n=1 Tax=Nothobranchius furzeri TaxID=105023 RepID=A0A8C6ME67_NOTFU